MNGAVLSLGDSLQGRARVWFLGVFPLLAIVLVGRPAWEAHTSATAGGEFVYLLCLYPQPISGAGSGHKLVSFQHRSCQALGDEHMCCECMWLRKQWHRLANLPPNLLRV